MGVARPSPCTWTLAGGLWGRVDVCSANKHTSLACGLRDILGLWFPPRGDLRPEERLAKSADILGWRSSGQGLLLEPSGWRPGVLLTIPEDGP